MRIIVADDKVKERAALRRLLEGDFELHVVGEADELESLLAQVTDCQPNVVLMDWGLTGLSASSVLRTLHSLCCPLKVIALGNGRSGQYEALAAGVDACASREEPAEWLLSTLRTVAGLSPVFAG